MKSLIVKWRSGTAGERWCTIYTLIKITGKAIWKKDGWHNENRAFSLRFHA
jgi:hypothetical protein